MVATCRGVPIPPPDKRIIVHRVTTCETELFVVLSASPWGKNIHWWGRRSHECHGPESQCEGCKQNWPQKWKGYLHVMTAQGNTEAFLELTAACIEGLVKQLPADENWRGLQIRIRRTKGGAKGRYLTEILERRLADETLPIERDPLPVLRRLWAAKKAPSQAA